LVVQVVGEAALLSDAVFGLDAVDKIDDVEEVAGARQSCSWLVLVLQQLGFPTRSA